MVKPLILSATILASVLTSTWSSSLLFGSASLAQDLDRCSPPKVFQQAAEANFYPNTIRQGNSFAPEDGYEWGYPEDPAKKVFRVIRVPHGTPSRLHPNTVWTGDGKLLPAAGYRWVTQSPGDFTVEPVPSGVVPPGYSNISYAQLVYGDRVVLPAAGYRWVNPTAAEDLLVEVIPTGTSSPQFEVQISGNDTLKGVEDKSLFEILRLETERGERAVLRRLMILLNVFCTFNVADNPAARAYPDPVWSLHFTEEVSANTVFIEDEARRLSLDPDFVKAIVWLETTHGWYDRAKKEPDTIRPMNVHRSAWKEMSYPGKGTLNFNDVQDNIRAGVYILSELWKRVEQPSIERVATLYNSLGADRNVSMSLGHLPLAFSVEPRLSKS
jgi:hypothetical protein